MSTADDPSSPEAVEESRLALIELLDQSRFDALQRIGVGLRDGRMELSLQSDGGFTESWVAKLCLPTSIGRQHLDGDAEQELLECVRAVVHAGDAYVGWFRIVHIPSRTAWSDRAVRPKPVGLLGDRYELLGSLGRGGFAEVFEARDVIDGHSVAVKVLFEQPDAVRQEQALERMRREMRILFEIRHSNVIPILNYGQLEDGRLWYVMPLAGGTLKDRMPSLPRDAATQLAVMEDIAAGVDALHERGVVHRDLTPANVLYLDGRWVVADFGLTVDLARESEALTQTGWGLGTVHYAPPERMTAKDATTAWDVFSFGQLVLDMISGVLAPERAGQPWPEHAFAPAIRRATAHSPSERFDSCSALVEECRRLQQLEVNEGWESPAERYGRIADELRQPADAVRAFDEMAAVLDREPELVGNFTSSLGALVESQVEELAGARPDAFRRVFDLVVTTLPTNFSSFDALDPMGGFVRRAAVVGDDHLATEGLRWLTQVGGDWNRWHVQGLGQALAEDLRVTRVHVIRPALEACDEAYWSNTLPDPEVLPPDARPRRAGETEPSADIEPF